MNDCIFCKIVAGEIPAHKVYEDEHTLAFLDIKPLNHGHVLLIPKDHFENIYTLPDETLCRVMIVVRKLAIAIKNSLDTDGINLLMNNEAGQEVPHAHIHVIPRFIGDGFKQWDHKIYLPGEAEAIIEKIKSELQN